MVFNPLPLSVSCMFENVTLACSFLTYMLMIRCFLCPLTKSCNNLGISFTKNILWNVLVYQHPIWVFTYNHQRCVFYQDQSVKLHQVNPWMFYNAMVNYKTVKSPFVQRTVLPSGSAEEIEASHDLLYQSLVGCLRWSAATTRPDISYVASQLEQFNTMWTISH